jgi:DNA-binding SARP family transcriptional activator
MLGPLEVVDESRPIRLGGAKQRAILAILLLSANRVVSVDRLADDLYAGASPVTALKQVQRHVSDLRKLLGPAAIETRSPGYLLRVAAEELDLGLFERLTGEANDALLDGEARRAVELLRRALDLWRGAPLADLAYESFAQAPIERLDEMRLAALQLRIEAELASGRHADVVAELEQLVREYPLRESFRGQLMLALYRSGRQVDALATYRAARETFAAELGMAPSPALQELERAILRQDSSLDSAPATQASAVERAGAVLVVPSDDSAIDGLLSLAAPLVRARPKDLIVARLVADEVELGDAVASVDAARARTGDLSARVAAFTTDDFAADVIRLAATYEADLVLLDARGDVDAVPFRTDLATILLESSADVALARGIPETRQEGDGVFIPFGGAEHDWAALELAAWLASATDLPLRLVGSRSDQARGRRDASRLLANASLAVQRITDVVAQPLLVEATEAALVEAVATATAVVVGISPRWRQDGIGAVRRALVRAGSVPVVLVRGGQRPGALAPRESRTRFSWSIER